MCERGEPLRETVTAKKRQHRDAQIKRQSVRKKKKCAGDKPQAASNSKNGNLRDTQNSGGYVPSGGAWISGVDTAINEPIERHRGAACRDHTKENPK